MAIVKIRTMKTRIILMSRMTAGTIKTTKIIAIIISALMMINGRATMTTKPPMIITIIIKMTNHTISTI